MKIFNETNCRRKGLKDIQFYGSRARLTSKTSIKFTLYSFRYSEFHV